MDPMQDPWINGKNKMGTGLSTLHPLERVSCEVDCHSFLSQQSNSRPPHRIKKGLILERIFNLLEDLNRV